MADNLSSALVFSTVVPVSLSADMLPVAGDDIDHRLLVPKD